MEFLRRHPRRVRSLALGGVATPAQKLPLQFAAGAQAALAHLLADCAADEPCRGAFPDLAADLATVLTRFDAGPVTFDLPRAAGEEAERVSLSQALFAEHVRPCREWPRGAAPAAFYEPVASAVPVLLLSGELDAATPAHYATTLARGLPNARQVLIRNAAHEYFADCPRDLVADFFAQGSARDLDTRCVETLRRPPFVTR